MFEDTLSLAERAAGGDAEAVDALTEQHLPSLRAYVRGRLAPDLRAMESVCDVVQTACREVLAAPARPRHENPSAFRRWLFTTSSRKVSDRLAERRAREHETAPAPRGGAGSGVSDSGLFACYQRLTRASRRGEQRDELARIESALDRLKEEQREVLLLAHLAEVSRGEIAERLGRSEVAIHSILQRALARMELELSEEEEG